MSQCACLRRKTRADRAVAHLQRGRGCTGMGALAGIFDPALAFGAKHPRAVIWQMEPSARDGHGQRVPSVQAEKPDSGFFTKLHISADIQFRKCRQPGQCRRRSQPNTRHAKRNDRQPRLAVELVDLQAPGNQRAQFFRINWPMREE
jgi:hypothetical protein